MEWKIKHWVEFLRVIFLPCVMNICVYLDNLPTQVCFFISKIRRSQWCDSSGRVPAWPALCTEFKLPYHQEEKERKKEKLK
jgi:hypothetical protein